MSDAASRIPNLYQLLGLTPLESDRGKISAAIERLQKAELKEASAGSDELERRQKIAALAHKYLLDPQRKTLYDQQWKAAYQNGSAIPRQAPAPEEARARASQSPAPPQHAVSSKRTAAGTRMPTDAAPAVSAIAMSKTSGSAAAVATQAVGSPPSPRWDYSRLDQLLPQGDPQVAFDMSSFLRTGGESRDPLAAQADLNKLVALLSDAVPVGDSTAAAVPLAGHMQEPRYGHEESGGHSLGLPPSNEQGQSFAAGSGLARRKRQRKQRALVLGGSVLLAGIGGLVLLGVFLFGPEPASSDAQLALAAQEKPRPVRGSGLPQIDLAAAPPAVNASENTPIVGSGLPKPGEGAMNLAIEVTPPTGQPTEPMPGPNPQSVAMPVGTPANSVNAPAQPTTVPAPQPKPEPEPKPEPDPAPATEPQPADEPKPEDEPKLSTQEKRAWQKGMMQARELIGQHDFEAAEKQLTELKSVAKTGQQRGQLQRLEEVLGFVKDVRQAMVDAIAGLGPAETFKVGTSTLASFVEGDDQRITLRVSGERRSYALEDVPVALGLALADLKMDVEHASSLARKGAYVITHPKNKAMLERGKQMLQTAAAAGAITSELATFYEDDYGLSKNTN